MPSAACEECAACPVNATSTIAYPRCAITRSSHVGSPTRQASGSRPSRNSSTASVPMLACSSSATSARTMSPAVPAAAAASAAVTIAATPAFMSHAPRPSSRPLLRPPVTRPANGSAIPAMPTVSRCPFSSRLRPPPVPACRATRLGRPVTPAAGTTSTANPPRSSRRASSPATAASPAAPGTSPGLTLSVRTSSTASSTAASAAALPLTSPVHHAAQPASWLTGEHQATGAWTG